MNNGIASGEMIDIIGVGFGPANIALAIAAEELYPNLVVHFLESSNEPGWQDGMLLPESDIQNHPLRDLVTPRNPRSRYTFVNFLHEKDRLFEHLNLPLSHPLRIEYREYVRWVAKFFDDKVSYGARVVKITPIISNDTIDHYVVSDSIGCQYKARSVVVAPGRTPNIPPVFSACNDPRAVHFTQFLREFEAILSRCSNPKIAVIGGSQTAVELMLHLSGDHRVGEVIGVHRNFGYRLKDTSPFSDEVYFPAYVDLYHRATSEQKEKLREELRPTNYSSADRDVLDSLYITLYRNMISGSKRIRVENLVNVSKVVSEQDKIVLHLDSEIRKFNRSESFDFVVLATGFKDFGISSSDERTHPLFDGVAAALDLSSGYMAISRNYSVELLPKYKNGSSPIFANGLCESSHGMGDAGSFSLLSLRAKEILDAYSEVLYHSKKKQALLTKSTEILHRPTEQLV